MLVKLNQSQPKKNLKKRHKPRQKKKPAVKKAAPKKTQATDFSKLTVSQLKEEAKKKGIEGIASMKKADLIAALSK